MNAKVILFTAICVLGSVTLAQPDPQAPTVSKHIAKILSRSDGLSERTAYRVSSVHDEYEVLKALGLTSDKQSLVQTRKPYDVLETKDPRTGALRVLWFDISSFYPEL